MQNFMRRVRLCYWISNKIVTNQGITVNIGNIQIHNHAFWISSVVTWRRTKMYKGSNTHFRSSISRTPPNSDRVNVHFGVWGYSKTQWMLFWASYRTAHLTYKYWTDCTVLIYCTVLTVITQKLTLHVQLHNRRETAKLMSSEVKCRRFFEII